MIFNNDPTPELRWKWHLNSGHLRSCIDDAHISTLPIITFIENHNIALLKYALWLANMLDPFTCGFKSLNVIKEIVSNCSVQPSSHGCTQDVC